MIEPKVGERYYWRGNPADQEWFWGEALAVFGSYVWMKPEWTSRRQFSFKDLALDKFVVFVPQTLYCERLKWSPARNIPGPLPHDGSVNPVP